ncbi:ribosomal protein S18 acetylase RimI-like enzyme [Hamadaea flava]|uniref:GNAT family N-acetyltransferase n=1 Tax=Hamadaea flava TaxID=1742688 RepID=A0ABV8M1I9_9ACTN|nr:GNAT family N-acetyltransferase [Hamadaea flava]MCP2328444.1 ribosomal protein S18 acetylase RimI-like enzyme [Hamadaea flava]
MDDVVISLFDSTSGRELVDAICDVYDEVFSAPPFFWRDDESDLHRDRLIGLFDDPSFGLAVAMEGDDLVGFAYGFTVPSDTQRWHRLVEQVDPEVAREWPGRTFMLFDYAVLAAHRGRGIGRRLHDVLLASRSEERATLTVQPTALETKRLYERWGWRTIGQIEGGPTAAAPLFDCYLRDSLDDLRESS